MSDNKLVQLLEVMAVIHPQPMNFANIIGTDKIDEDIKSGSISRLIAEGLIESTDKKYHYRISEKGKQVLESGLPDEDMLDEPTEKMMRPSIQPHSWEHKDIMLHEPLFKNKAAVTADLPLLAFGVDRPDMFEPLQKTPNNEKYAGLFRAAAMRNIVKEPVEMQDVAMGDFKMTVVTGSYYAIEKIFDEAFMKKIQADHNYLMLAVGLPRKGTMYITNGVMAPEIMSKFVQVIGFKYAENEQTKAISKTAFLVQDGKLNGIIRVNAEGALQGAAKKSFFGKLFGKK